MPTPLPDASTRRRLRPALLRWYRRHHRDLPWRAAPGERPNAYHVLVSEAMLQQTQVATVIPYFHRFIEALPRVADLAAADEAHVLRLWQGLGYYRRARNLHAAAKQIIEDHHGEVPTTAAELRQLPGVGDYTAGAIASIAFNRTEPILDGNVARLLSRLFAIDASIDQTPTKRALWAIASDLVRGRHPGAFNQGLMELGALVCTKQSPQCLVCPVADHCRAYAAGLTETLPQRAARRPPQAVTHRVIAVAKNNQYLFEQRGDAGLWAGLWQLPTREQPEQPANPAAAAQWARDRFGLSVAVADEPVTRFTHQTTHRTIHFIVFEARVRGGRLRPRAGVWRRLGRQDDLPLANPQHRAIAALRAT